MPPPDPPAAPAASGWRRLRWLVSLLAGFAAGLLFATVGLAFGRFLLPAPPPGWVAPLPGLMLAAALLSAWPHLLLHEAGHALAGMARGMRPLAFGLGPFRWERGQSGWRWRRGGRIAGIGGFASLVPAEGRGQSRVDLAIFALGGPAANLATAALVVALLPLASTSRAGMGALLGIALSAAMIGAINLVPFVTQGWRSDGRVLLDLLRGAPDATLQLRLQRLVALSMAGVRPRDWPPALLPGPAADPAASPLLAANALLLRLAWAMDRDDAGHSVDIARGAVALWPALPAVMRPHVAVAIASLAAHLLRDRDLLGAWRPLCDGGLVDLSLPRAWLDAEAAALAGDAAAARAHLDAARALLPTAHDPVTAMLLREHLDALDARMPR